MVWIRIFLAQLHAWQWLGIPNRANRGRPAILSFGAQQTFPAGTSGANARNFGCGKDPFPELNAVFVSTVEFVFGLLLILGALTPVACVMLACVMIVAIATTAIKNIKAPSVLGWLSKFLSP